MYTNLGNIKIKQLKFATYLKYDNNQKFFIIVVLSPPAGCESYEKSIADNTDEIHKVENTVPHSYKEIQ